MIQLHRLEGLYWVVREKGYAAAARAFPYPITQPAVYQQVRKLEEELGTPLFERVGRDRVEPTAAARKLYDFCAPFFEALPPLVRSITSGTFGGTLRVEAAPLEIRHVLPSWIQRLRAKRPDIEVQLTEVQTPDATRLLGGRVDLVVDHLPSVPLGVTALQIAEHHVFLIMPATWPKPQPKRVGAALGAQPFISYTPDLFQYAMQVAGLSALHVVPQRKLSASSTEALLGFVAAGLGYSLIPWPTRKGPELANVRALRLHDERARFPIHLAYRTSAASDPLVVAALRSL